MSHTIYAAKFEQIIIHQHEQYLIIGSRWFTAYQKKKKESQSHAQAHVLMRLYPIDKSLVC